MKEEQKSLLEEMRRQSGSRMYFEGMGGTRRKRRKSLELVRQLCGGGGRSMGLSEMMWGTEVILK